MRPCFFYRDSIDYVVVGLGKLSFRELVNALDNRTSVISIPGIAKTDPGMTLNYVRQTYSFQDSVDASPPPRYDLVKAHRNSYVMSGVGGKVGFVVSAYG